MISTLLHFTLFTAHESIFPPFPTRSQCINCIYDVVHSSMSTSSAEDILKEIGLARITERLCTEKHLRTMQDIANLRDANIDDIVWLTYAQNRKLKTLCEACRRGGPSYYNEVVSEELKRTPSPDREHRQYRPGKNTPPPKAPYNRRLTPMLADLKRFT